MVAINPEITQITKADPTEPDFLNYDLTTKKAEKNIYPRMPCGEMKIPDPIMVPTVSAIPPYTVIDRFNFALGLTPLDMALTPF